MECAENPVGGGLVSHAEWTGVALASVLQARTRSPRAQLSGADGFSRGIPLAKAMDPDTLLALTMNGEKLPVNHGFPLRAIIPGWYGMDSVKWLRASKCYLPRKGLCGYIRLVRSLRTGTQSSARVTAMQVKSTFSRPLDGAILMNRHFTVRGAAWAGENRIRQVEVSTNAGNVAGSPIRQRSFALCLASVDTPMEDPRLPVNMN